MRAYEGWHGLATLVLLVFNSIFGSKMWCLSCVWSELAKAHDQHLLVSDTPEKLSKNVTELEISGNISPVYFFFKDGFGVFLLLGNLSKRLVTWLVK